MTKETTVTTKLGQIIAVEKGVKTQLNDGITAAYHKLQSSVPFAGISRTYRPRDDEGEALPPERTSVQLSAEEVLTDLGVRFARLFDITATKDATNGIATADVVVNGVTVVSNVSVMTLLWMEKQLIDLRTIITKLPILDPSKDWVLDPVTGFWSTEPVETTRTKKVLRNHVKAEATDKHPAQVETFTEDVIVGYWETKLFSGALPAPRIQELLNRVDDLSAAVKSAREQANQVEVLDKKIGRQVIDYLFAQ